MNEEFLERTKARVQEALKQTQDQGEEAASQLGSILRVGAAQLKKAADAASQAVRDDLNSRP